MSQVYRGLFFFFILCQYKPSLRFLEILQSIFLPYHFKPETNEMSVLISIFCLVKKRKRKKKVFFGDDSIVNVRSGNSWIYLH